MFKLFHRQTYNNDFNFKMTLLMNEYSLDNQQQCLGWAVSVFILKG